MKVLIYYDDYHLVKNSGVGEAIKHQIRALEKIGFDYTLDKNDDFDLVHLNTVFPKSVFFARKMRRKKIPIIYSAHSTKEDFKNSFILSNSLAPVFKKWLVNAYNLADFIITPTEYSKNILLTYDIKKEIDVISNGIDINFWKKREGIRESFCKKYNLDPNKKIIISVGLLINRKGIKDFVDLAKRMPEVNFIWFGKNDMKFLTSDVKSKLKQRPKNLILPGFVNKEELRDAYSCCDLYMFLTHEETEGIVLLEAFSTKADTLIRDIDIYEEFEDKKIVYKAKNIDEFEKKARDIINNRVISLTDEAYKIVKKRSIENSALKLKKVYEKAYNMKNGALDFN
ncbi:MAG: glycosyltransferase [Tissierellia bacterium]|nr:glycosyltransferase [Tissierellia bacterium]